MNILRSCVWRNTKTPRIDRERHAELCQGTIRLLPQDVAASRTTASLECRWIEPTARHRYLKPHEAGSIRQIECNLCEANRTHEAFHSHNFLRWGSIPIIYFHVLPIFRTLTNLNHSPAISSHSVHAPPPMWTTEWTSSQFTLSMLQLFPASRHLCCNMVQQKWNILIYWTTPICFHLWYLEMMSLRQWTM